MTAVLQRLVTPDDERSPWKKWGPYLSERAWGTVREDYSPDGSAWAYFPHDHARSRAYRWNEDGLAGICDRNQHLCFALALWNGRDPILKERLFGLAGPEGNHGEDVKEVYYYLDSTPTHCYMKMLYKYPQAAFPYADLVAENGRRGYDDFEYELLDTGVLDGDRYFDVFVEYAKANEEDILVRLTAINRGPDHAELHLLPTLWFRNTWSWGYADGPLGDVPGRPQMRQVGEGEIEADHPAAGRYWLTADQPLDLYFTENETNNRRLFDSPNQTPYVKDAFHRLLIGGQGDAVNPTRTGTKGAVHFRRTLEPGEAWEVRLRLANRQNPRPFHDFPNLLAARQQEADEFYTSLQKPELTPDEKRVQRQAFAGLLWSKQLYYYDVLHWLSGDPLPVRPPAARLTGRNADWRHLNNFDVLSMPDKWEYPWYAAWDLAFHTIPLVLIDPAFAKQQLVLMTREWYMHPNGQLPAYEWAFGDVNPPVHAWAAWRVYKIDLRRQGRPDLEFLEGIFHKLLLNFTWWVNRKDIDGNNVFQGGFLGLDNISLFDRSQALPTGGRIDQADGTAWMGFYSLGMLRIALELAKYDPIYQDLGTKFFEHFLSIAEAMSQGFDGAGLWDEADGFFYDILHLPDERIVPLKVRSLVGLIPLLAVEILEPGLLEKLPVFTRRMHWYLQNRPQLIGNMTSITETGQEERHMLGVVTRERLACILGYMLDEQEFLSPYGIRSLSKIHETPYLLDIGGNRFRISYQPAEARSGLFGGNSNWRGPIWFPINFLLIEALQKYHHYFGADFTVELPTGSGNWVTLKDVARDLSRRLTSIFLQTPFGRRPVYGGLAPCQSDPHWRDYILFHEYFHGDNGAGLGASHQTGWTGLVAKLIQQSGGRP